MYLHYSYFIYGHARIPIVGWLREQASEGVTHATLVGDKIIALGGEPVTQPAAKGFPPKFGSLNEMLSTALAFERETFDMYHTLMNDVGDTPISVRLFLEAMLTEESGHIEEIEKMLRPDSVH
jgi:bacterioferritin